MPPFQLDLHFHTTASRDSAIPASVATARRIHREGLAGIAITDHDTMVNVSRFSKILDREGLIAIPGEEVKSDTGGEILCYFLQEPIKPGSREAILDAVQDQGAIAVLAHPFDHLRGNWWRHLASPVEACTLLRRVDGLEAFNARNYSPRGNATARLMAARLDMLATGGSDAHNAFEIGSGRSIVHAASRHLDDLRAAFDGGSIEPCHRETITAPLRDLPRLQNLKQDIPRLHRVHRAISGAWKKAHSAMNSFLPGFKSWQASIASRASRQAPQDTQAKQDTQRANVRNVRGARDHRMKDGRSTHDR